MYHKYPCISKNLFLYPKPQLKVFLFRKEVSLGGYKKRIKVFTLVVYHLLLT